VSNITVAIKGSVRYFSFRPYILQPLRLDVSNSIRFIALKVPLGAIACQCYRSGTYFLLSGACSANTLTTKKYLPMIRALQLLLITTVSFATAQEQPLAASHDADRSHYLARFANVAPSIDGSRNDVAWESAQWRPLNNIWLGGPLEPTDFNGRYKVTWTEQKLYVLVEFTDDVLVDFHRDPLTQYWDDDCLEIFIDEDHSGGDHQYNHNAFAYHMSLDNRAIDIGSNKMAQEYTHHTRSQWRQQGDKVVWEISVDIYNDEYRDSADDNQPVALQVGKVMGFMLAYCDNDHSELREHFIGSEHAAGDHKDRGWIDAGLFGTLELAD
jgi:hypothetical protein